jgi:hypothetical protein
MIQYAGDCMESSILPELENGERTLILVPMTNHALNRMKEGAIVGLIKITGRYDLKEMAEV